GGRPGRGHRTRRENGHQAEGPAVWVELFLAFECQSATIWHFGTQLHLALGTLALSFVWHLALWHSASFGTWHFGTQLRLPLGTLPSGTRESEWHLALWHSRHSRKQKVALQLNPPLARTK